MSSQSQRPDPLSEKEMDDKISIMCQQGYHSRCTDKGCECFHHSDPNYFPKRKPKKPKKRRSR
jgi:hypothetical protein